MEWESEIGRHMLGGGDVSSLLLCVGSSDSKGYVVP